jgi:hypothetical protein
MRFFISFSFILEKHRWFFYFEVAELLGLVGAWRLMRVCRAARVGAREFLSTLPGLVVCGGRSHGARVRDVWRLDLATLR